MTHAIIQADFVDTRRVKSRSVLQIICEVAIEQEPHVMELLGWPKPGGGLPVAIARLNEVATPGNNGPLTGQKPQAGTMSAAQVVDKPRPLSQEAHLLCNRRDFQQWLGVDGYAAADARIKELVGIGSKSELDTKQTEALAFMSLANEFKSEWLLNVSKA